jgi:adenylate kinase
MKKDILLFGMPWAGKGTQADLLKHYMNEQYIHLSTWDVFRALMSHSNAIGDLVHERMNQWLLIDDKVTISLFDAYFFSVIEADKYMLLDWYPRSIPQLNNFLSKAHDNNRALLGIYFDINE